MRNRPKWRDEAANNVMRMTSLILPNPILITKDSNYIINSKVWYATIVHEIVSGSFQNFTKDFNKCLQKLN